jgi:Kelch motif
MPTQSRIFLIARTILFVLAAIIAGCSSAGISEAPVYVSNAQGQRVVALSMTTPRADAAAVKLLNGKVLICGGTSTGLVGGVLNSAELYNPATETFEPTGSMNDPRQGQTITLLKDGRVLVTGGARNIGYRAELSSAEIYDPSSGTFSPTASMSVPREGHTATLLNDGRVLITGGSDNGQHTISTAEIYDPGVGTFGPTGSMTVPREAHTATLLLSGQVLIAGGGRAGMPGGYIVYQNGELFDPRSGTFSAINSPMKSDRVGASAVLLVDGRALIVGGKSSRVLLAGTFGGTRSIASFAPLNTAEYYDPESHSFQKAPDMRGPHYLGTATLLTDGSVLVTGGWLQQGPVVIGSKESDLYDATMATFDQLPPMHVGRLTQTATLLDGGKVLVAGGINGKSYMSASVEFYEPMHRRFELLPEGEPTNPPPQE